MSTNQEPTNRDMSDRRSIRSWLDRPLCRSYVVAVFSSCSVLTLASHGQVITIHWAFGSLIDGESEVLGAWFLDGDTPAVPAGVFSDMLPRGAEFIRIGVGDFAGAEAAFTQIYRHGELVPSVEQTVESLASRVAKRHRLEVSASFRAVAEAEDADARRSELEKFQASCLGKRYPEVAERWGRALAGFERIYALSAQLRGLVRSADRTAAEVHGRLTRAILRHGPFVDSTAALDFVAGTLDRAEQRLDRERAIAVAAREAGSTTLRRSPPIADAVSVPALA